MIQAEKVFQLIVPYGLKDVLFLSILNFCTFIFFFLNLLASLIDRELEKSPLAGEFVADFIVTAFRLD